MKHEYSQYNNEFWSKTRQEIRDRLLAEHPKAKVSRNHIQSLICPSCGKDEAWAYHDKPLSLNCPRRNNCGKNTPIKHIYPDLFASLVKRFPPSEKDRKATARAYLQSRGMDDSKIEFSQGSVNSKEDGKFYTTLEMKAAPNSTFHRLIDYSGKNKTRLFGSYKGEVWKPDVLDFNQPIWIVEGIFDAISLNQSGLQAIATLSSSHLPEKFYKDSAICECDEIIIAFDGDEAGKKATDKHRKFFDSYNEQEDSPDCNEEKSTTNLGEGLDEQTNISECSENKRQTFCYTVAIPPFRKDWNDLLLEGELDEEQVSKTIDDAKWRGRLHCATDATDYFSIYCEKMGSYKAIFEYKKQMYLGRCIETTEEEDEDDYNTKRLADCSISIAYSIEDDTLEFRSKTKHRIQIHSYREGKLIVEFTSEELASLDMFKKRLMHQRQLFFGNAHDLLLLTEHLFKKKPLKIRQCHALGYDKKSNCYVFSKFLYDSNGSRFSVNKDGFFEEKKIVPFRDKSTEKLSDINIKTFLENLFQAYQYRGLIALGFWVSGLFSHLIFEYFGFFPFLSLYGDSRCGKSDLTKLLNRCFFQDWEGIPMSMANTKKGELRKISQKASLVTPMLEGRKDDSKFKYESILPYYNRNPLQIRAQTSQDNETHELAFEGVLAFVQNQEQFRSKPAKERVISIFFEESQLSESSYEGWRGLMKYSPEQLAFVGHSILSQRKWFEERIVKKVQEFGEHLKNVGVTVDRIAKNHAIAMAGIDLVFEVFDFHNAETGTVDYLVQLSKTKIETARNENPIGELFFSTLKSLSHSGPEGTIRSGFLVKEDLLILHLPTALKTMDEQNYGSWNRSELVKALRDHEGFVELKTSRLLGEKKDCWFFNHTAIDYQEPTIRHSTDTKADI
jgi:hypothetical protein